MGGYGITGYGEDPRPGPGDLAFPPGRREQPPKPKPPISTGDDSGTFQWKFKYALRAGAAVGRPASGRPAAGGQRGDPRQPRFQVSPAERLAWVPESRTDDAWMSWLRAGQWQDDRVAERHRALFRWTYNAGIVAFLLGLLAALLPEPGGWTWPRVLALCVGAAAVAVEVVLTVEWPGALRRRLSPTSADLREQDAKTEASLPVPIDGRQLRALVYENGDGLAVDVDRLGDRLDVMSGELSAIALRLDQPGPPVPPAPPPPARPAGR